MPAPYDLKGTIEVLGDEDDEFDVEVDRPSCSYSLGPETW